MILELLANETLLDLFEFFHVVDLLLAFHGLNSRFNALLFVHFRHFHVDLRSISKHDFDFICRQYLPSIVDRVISLHLSDDDDTPQQMDLFLARGFTVRHFTHLRSLSLHRHSSDRILRIMQHECHLLHHLTRLKVTGCGVGWNEDFSECLTDMILSLPKLTHCHLGFNFYSVYPIPTVISSTLECLSIEGFNFSMNRIFSLLEHTPRLRRLHVNIKMQYGELKLQSTALSLTILKIILNGSLETLVSFLEHTPNLCQLTVETEDIEPDGHRWEQIITDYLPKLNVFRLKMEFESREDAKERADEVLHSF
jgi:hypothetical protein